MSQQVRKNRLVNSDAIRQEALYVAGVQGRPFVRVSRKLYERLDRMIGKAIVHAVSESDPSGKTIK